jgi:hypothetical protein
MVGATEEQPPQSGGENVGVTEDVRGQGDEGRRAADAAPPIAEDAEPGQTAVPAPDDETGVPPDEELSRPEE